LNFLCSFLFLFFFLSSKDIFGLIFLFSLVLTSDCKLTMKLLEFDWKLEILRGKNSSELSFTIIWLVGRSIPLVICVCNCVTVVLPCLFNFFLWFIRKGFFNVNINNGINLSLVWNFLKLFFVFNIWLELSLVLILLFNTSSFSFDFVEFKEFILNFLYHIL